MANDPAWREGHRIRWALLAAGFVAATLVPIGLHTVMLDYLGIPYPNAFPHTGWPALPDHAMRIFALYYLDAALRGDPRFGGAARMLLLFVAVAALNEDVLRLPIMRNAVSTRWTVYPFVDNLPQVLRYAVLAVVVSATGPLVQKIAARAAAAVAIAVCTDFAFSPWLDHAFAPIVAANATREGDQLYTVPYDWHVDLPSYLTFAEPAVAALLLAWLLARGGRSLPVIALLLFGLRAGPLFGVVLNIFYAPTDPALAMLSKGQFALETGALALIAASITTRVRTMLPARHSADVLQAPTRL